MFQKARQQASQQMDAFLISQSTAIFWLENFLAGCTKSFIGCKNKDNLGMTRFLKEL